VSEAEKSTEMGGARHPQLAGCPGARLRRGPTSYPIAPTEFPKGPSTTRESGARRHHRVRSRPLRRRIPSTRPRPLAGTDACLGLPPTVWVKDYLSGINLQTPTEPAMPRLTGRRAHPQAGACFGGQPLPMLTGGSQKAYNHELATGQWSRNHGTRSYGPSDP
jgi:hypothetical protein